MQLENIDFHNSFAPFGNWSNVRLIIMMYEMAGWESRNIIYVLVLYQAPIYSDVYLHLPASFIYMEPLTISQPAVIDKNLKQIRDLR